MIAQSPHRNHVQVKYVYVCVSLSLCLCVRYILGDFVVSIKTDFNFIVKPKLILNPKSDLKPQSCQHHFIFRVKFGLKPIF